MTVVPFRRPETRKENAPPPVRRRSLGEFAAAMGVIGLVLFMLPSLWSGFSSNFLAVIHLLVAVVYFQQGPKVAAGVWIGLTIVLLALTGAPSPVSYALARGAAALSGIAP